MSDDPKNELRQFLPGRARARELADTGAAEARIARALDSAALHVARDEIANDVVNDDPATAEPAPEAANPAIMTAPEPTPQEAPLLVVAPVAVEDAEASATQLSAQAPPRRAAFRGPKRDEPAAAPVPPRGQTGQRKKPMSAVLISVLAVLAVAVPTGLALWWWPKPMAPLNEASAPPVATTTSERPLAVPNASASEVDVMATGAAAMDTAPSGTGMSVVTGARPSTTGAVPTSSAMPAPAATNPGPAKKRDPNFPIRPRTAVTSEPAMKPTAAPTSSIPPQFVPLDN